MTETPTPPPSPTRPRTPQAFALVLHPGGGSGADDDAWRAVLVSAEGETHRFRSLAGLVRFLAAASAGPPPEGGLR